MIGAAIGWFSIKAFTEPSAITDSNTTPSITVSVQGIPNTAPVGVVLDYSDRGDLAVDFPQAYLGRTWMVMLSEGAAPDDLKIEARDGSSATQYSCGTGCAIIEGTITKAGSNNVSDFAGRCSDKESKSQSIVAELGLFGDFDAIHSINWAFGRIQAPYIDTGGGSMPIEFGTPPPGASGPFYELDTYGCERVELPDNFGVAATSIAPDGGEQDNELTWLIENRPEPTLIIRWNSALEWANAGIVITGILFTSAAAIFPLWLQGRLSRPRRIVRASHMRPTNASRHPLATPPRYRRVKPPGRPRP